MPFLPRKMLVVLLSAALVVLASASDLSVTVTNGPSLNGGACPEESQIIQTGSYVSLHFKVSIDESSASGTPGHQFESTYDTNEPVGVTIGQGQVIAGWDQGLMGLCQGDAAVLVVPPELAYGAEGTGTEDHDIPGGATIRFDIDIVAVEPAMSEEEQLQHQRTAYDEADKDGDGKLSMEEFFHLVFAHEGIDNYEDGENLRIQLMDFWKHQDKNEDNFMSFEEFTTLHMDDLDDLEGHDMTAREEFDQLDTDGDGKLSHDEIHTFFTSMEEPVPDDFWEQVDADGDGFISYEEYELPEDEEPMGEEL